MAKVKRVPQRICVGCGQTRGKKELIRIVRTPDYHIVIDATGKMSGRGAYLCCRMECLTAALAGKQLERALRVELPEDVITVLRKTVLGEIN